MNNKGVNINIDTDSESICKPSPKKTISRVKQDLEAVINLMGPDTFDLKATGSDDDSSNSCKIKEKDKSIIEDSINKTTCTEVLPSDDPTISSARAEVPSYSVGSCTHPMFQMDQSCFCQQIASLGFPPCPPPHMCNVHNGTQIMGYMNQKILPVSKMNENTTARYQRGRKKKNVYNWFRCALGKPPMSDNSFTQGSDYYKINVKQSTMNQIPPKKLVFELVNRNKKTKNNCKKNPNLEEEIKNPATGKEYKNMQNEKLTSKEFWCGSDVKPIEVDEEGIINNCIPRATYPVKTTYFDYENGNRVDVYYFDHGDAKFLQTVNRSPLASTELLAEKTENYTTKFWAEVFGTIHIGFSFCTSFIIQLFRFLMVSLVRPLTIGLIQLLSDYFFKPCLTVIFNGVVQPPLIFLYNIATSVRDLLFPIAEGLGYFLKEISVICKACRLIDIKREKCKHAQTECNFV